MKTIYKYGINAGFTFLKLPRGARIFSVNYDPQGILSAWAAVDTEEEIIETHTLYLTGTGWPLEELDGYNYRFIDTAIDEANGLVWHIFEVEEQK
jgi:hypothetical protein